MMSFASIVFGLYSFIPEKKKQEILVSQEEYYKTLYLNEKSTLQ